MKARTVPDARGTSPAMTQRITEAFWQNEPENHEQKQSRGRITAPNYSGTLRKSAVACSIIGFGLS